MKKISAELFKQMLIGGANNLSHRVDEINELNIFPVPDGDTGTNMNITAQSGKKAIESLKKGSTIEEITAAFSKSSLLGASGNSGVILSQFFKGISIGVQGKEELAEEDFVKIFNEAKTLAYKSVKNPVEGTILTLTKSLAEHAKKHNFKKIIKKSKDPKTAFFNEVLKVIKETVENTPNLLPALKEANVVDAGAFGLGIFIEGMIKTYQGEKISVPKKTKTKKIVKHNIGEVGFCTEVTIQLDKAKIDKFKSTTIEKSVNKFGTSTVIVVDQEIVKVHTHTLTPDKLLKLAQKQGKIIKSKIDNMQDQINHNKAIDNKQKVSKALIAVSSGKGISDTFKKLGVHYIIEGGQTQNPSTQQFVNAIKSIDAKQYYIFVNNKNIFMSALASKLSFKRKKIYVVKTKTMWEGINSLMQFVDDDKHSDIKKEQKEIRKKSITIQVTKAIKKTKFLDKKIKKGDLIAISNGKILFNCKTQQELFINIAEHFQKVGCDYVYIIVGKKAKGLKTLEKELNTQGIDFDSIKGQQEVYSFIIGGEK